GNGFHQHSAAGLCGSHTGRHRQRLRCDGGRRDYRHRVATDRCCHGADLRSRCRVRHHDIDARNTPAGAVRSKRIAIMDHESLLRALLLIIPCVLAWLIILPLRKRLRIPLAVILGIVVAFGLTLVLSRGHLSFVVDFSIMAGLYAILALGLNSQWGYNGHLNFGVVGFFMLGAFTTALFTSALPSGLMAQYSQQAFGLELPFMVGVIAAAVISGLVGFLVAIPVLRLRVDFLAIATLGIALIFRLIFQNERWLANGPQPMRGIPQPLACLFDHPVDCGGWVPQAVATF